MDIRNSYFGICTCRAQERARDSGRSRLLRWCKRRGGALPEPRGPPSKQAGGCDLFTSLSNTPNARRLMRMSNSCAEHTGRGAFSQRAGEQASARQPQPALAYALDLVFVAAAHTAGVGLVIVEGGVAGRPGARGQGRQQGIRLARTLAPPQPNSDTGNSPPWSHERHRTPPRLSKLAISQPDWGN